MSSSALLVTGSEEFEGAGRLSLEAALRSGAGIIGYVSTSALRSRLIETFPEAIYHPLLDEPKKNISKICEASKKYSSVLIGSGSDKSEELYELVSALLSEEGSPIVLDADALNSLAEYGSADEIKNSKRVVILTPHPLELSRLAKIPVGEISKNRLKIAKSFAKDNRCILLLKGAQTLVTDGELLYINSTGNTALAKGGSGDVLSGALVSLLAFCDSPLKATALAAYLHGKAGDALSMIYSEFGVTPSDLPKQLAKEIKELSNE